MFSLDEIKLAHAKVKTGADFPNYIKDLSRLGVIAYETFVSDGHTVFFGENGFSVLSAAKYPALTISDSDNTAKFSIQLKAHQQGKTDYPTFCRDCAENGIEKWQVQMSAMTCTYYGKNAKELLKEHIPIS